MNNLFRTESLSKFEVGKTYYAEFIGDREGTVNFKIMRRTPSKIIALDSRDIVITRKINLGLNCEYIVPYGNCNKALILWSYNELEK